MRFTITLLMIFAFLAVGCGKQEPAAQTSAKVSAADSSKLHASTDAPQAVTTGAVRLQGMPGNIEPVVEVISIDPIPNKIVELITNQQNLLQAYLTPPKTSMKQPSDIVSAEDYQKITEQINALRQQYPAPVESEFYNDSGEPEMFTSRESLHKRYIPLFRAISVETMVPSINDISNQMRMDHATLEKLADQPGNEGLQARADINWLASLSRNFQQYQSVTRAYDLARRKQATLNTQTTGQTTFQSPIMAWKYFQQQTAPNIELEIGRTAAHTIYAEDDGSFEVEGHGKMIVRATLDGNSVFFIQDGPGAEHLKFSNLEQTTVDPT
ncbi:hypothetical protein [Cerasicoccus maritimus]|uniref:hypothetical protein n=1 Tax=Cerasicoccus maritimus TaxID=490089 RepID=UPI0028529631|nr:hypothetical protein [Cerasicoccus maritimus]